MSADPAAERLPLPPNVTLLLAWMDVVLRSARSRREIEQAKARLWDLWEQENRRSRGGPARLPLPPGAPRAMAYFDATVTGPRLRAILEDAKARLWRSRHPVAYQVLLLKRRMAWSRTSGARTSSDHGSH